MRGHFSGREGIVVGDFNGVFGMVLQDELFIRFKKMDSTYSVRSLYTHQHTKYMKQGQMDGLPAKPTFLKQYVGQMTIAEWHFMSMLDEIELPKINLPSWDIMEDGSAAMCAKFLREFWKIPKGRITNLTKVTEDNGVVIFALELGELDGFSTYFGGNIPVIFVNKTLLPDRYRLTVAHEIGHLICTLATKSVQTGI